MNEENESGECIRTVGLAKLILVDMEKADENDHDAALVLDATAETAEFYPLYQGGVGLVEELDCWMDNLLILSRLEIIADFRGKGITEQFMEDIKNFGGQTELLALKAFPLQFEAGYREQDFEGEDLDWSNSLELDGFAKDRNQAQLSLMKFYEKYGFKRFKDTTLMTKKI